MLYVDPGSTTRINNLTCEAGQPKGCRLSAAFYLKQSPCEYIQTKCGTRAIERAIRLKVDSAMKARRGEAVNRSERIGWPASFGIASAQSAESVSQQEF